MHCAVKELGAGQCQQMESTKNGGFWLNSPRMVLVQAVEGDELSISSGCREGFIRY